MKSLILNPNAPGLLNAWKPETLLSRLDAVPNQQRWLRAQTSLTRCLKQHCPALAVEVISETVAKPKQEEALRLGCSLNQKAWIRTVLLCCDTQPWVYARTVIPNFQPGNPWYNLKNWGKRPLGEMLFQMKNLTRSEFEMTRMSLENAFLNSEKTNITVETVLARRSVFSYQKAPLLLTEAFLNFPASEGADYLMLRKK